MKTALISVFDKSNLSDLVSHLLNNNYQILSSGGTYKQLITEFNSQNIIDISSYINHPEILNGRVKTLHPKIHGGILAKRNNKNHIQELQKFNINTIDIVIVNLYPFKEASNNPAYTPDDIYENIDIGGHTLIRASAKNFKDVLVVVDPNDYDKIINNENNIQLRRTFANKAFQYITIYDAYISTYFNRTNDKDSLCDDTIVRVYEKERKLKYGINPQQQQASLYKNIQQQSYPFTVINGNIGYINVLDAIYSWNLVCELKYILKLPACASFKHTSPAGSAVYFPLSNTLKRVYHTNDDELSELAVAYIRARNADPMSSYGDFIAVSEEVDVSTARLISKEVSDGIIAPSYDEKALEILRQKKGGNYIILSGSDGTNYPYNKCKNYYDNYGEIKELHGITLIQESNPNKTDYTTFNNIVSKNKTILNNSKQDMILANTTLKYTQSNSVAYSLDGQCIGIGAGQQSRIDCVKLGKRKVEMWYLRQHPKCIDLLTKFKKGTKKQQKINALVSYIENDFNDIEYQEWRDLFMEDVEIEFLTSNDKEEFIKTLDNVSLASDGFFPFPDNIHIASKIGVKYIIQPSGSIADDDIIKVVDGYGMSMVSTGNEMRMFLH